MSSSDFVDDLCARNTLAARTRILLLRLEKQGHKLGWDHPDNEAVFQVHYNPDNSNVEHQWSDAYTDIIRYVSGHNGGNTGGSFQALAEIVEEGVSGELEPHLPSRLRGVLPRSAPGTDLWPGKRTGWRFYGYGYRSEGWMVQGHMDEETERLSRVRQLDQHPDRVEIRQICLAARDGLLWWVHRIRGEEPTVHAELPESDGPMGGNIINGLSRLTNAVAANPVPVRAAVPRAFQRFI
jgi:hypothetical protein